MADPPDGSDPPPPKMEVPVAGASTTPEVDYPKEGAPPTETPKTEGSELPPLADGTATNASKRRRNKGRGNNAASVAGRNRPKRGGTSSALQLPQLKVTIRNIADVERHGTAAKLLGMVQALVDAVNAETSSGATPVSLDEESVERIIRAEELAAIAATEHEASKEGSDTMETVAEVDADPPETAADDEAKQEEAKAEGDLKPVQEIKDDPKPSAPAFSAVVTGTSEKAAKPENPNVVSARVLYVVPPKKSRRRGEKNGCAYLVLTPPRSLLITTPDEEPEPIMTQAERSRVLAEARLMLLNTLDAISHKAQVDARAGQVYGGCLVEQSLNVKTWKDRERNHRDRREGTIQQTADYRRFMANAEKAEQDRLNRPKPAPGGGAISVGTDVSNESGQPVAALVLHLRSKREAQKAKRRKAASAAKKKVDTKDNKPRRRGRREREKDKGRKRKAAAKKGNPKVGMGTSAVTPTLLQSKSVVSGTAKPAINGTG